MSDFMNNPFVSQKKKVAIQTLRDDMKAVYVNHPDDLEWVLDGLVYALIDNLPKILEAWTEEDHE